MPGTADREPSPQASAQLQGSDAHAHAAEAPSPPFEPVFALLTNATTHATVHPQIRYLFDDDDPSILTAAANPDPSHRTLVVDLAPAPAPNTPVRWSVKWASSLSQHFAVTSSAISLQQNETDDGGLMLKVEGVEREPVDARGDSLPGSGSGALGREDVEVLAGEFKRRMGVLNKVVAEGERRREVVGRGQGEESAVVDGHESVEKEPAEKEPKGKEKAEEEAQPKPI